MSIPNVLFSFAACVVNVEVNTLTGQVKVLNLAFVPEVGTLINPQGLEAQIEGGMIQSIGYALMEDMQVDAGKVRTPNFTTYLVPTMEDTPKPVVVPVAGVYEPTGPFGAKGAGELSTIAVPAGSAMPYTTLSEPESKRYQRRPNGFSLRSKHPNTCMKAIRSKS